MFFRRKKRSRLSETFDNLAMAGFAWTLVILSGIMAILVLVVIAGIIFF